MKNVKFLAALVIAVIFASCEKSTDGVDGSAHKTTDLYVGFNSQPELAGKAVGAPANVPVFVDNATITASYVGQPAYVKSETFTWTPGVPAGPAIVLEDVALGLNDFTAVTDVSSSAVAELSLTVDSSGSTGQELLSNMRARHPHVSFNGYTQKVVLDESVNNGNPTSVHFNMEANAGRNMSVVRFDHETALAIDDFSGVRITAIIDGVEGDQIIVEDEEIGVFYWSEDFVSTDKVVTLKLEHYEIPYSGNEPVIVKEQFIELPELENGVSMSCEYVITLDDVITNITPFTFTYEWEEVDCDDC